MGKHIRLSTAYNGEHRDFIIEEEEVTDAAMFREAMAPVWEYVAQLDQGIDSGGAFVTQATEVIDAAWEHPSRTHMRTLAVDDNSDLELFARMEED